MTIKASDITDQLHDQALNGALELQLNGKWETGSYTILAGVSAQLELIVTESWTHPDRTTTKRFIVTVREEA